MSNQDVFVVSRQMPASEARAFEVPFHYLVYAEAGVMRLEADGRRWTLPPARAGLVTAGHRVMVALPRPVTICSALFLPGVVPDPPQDLSVFEITPLARELLFSLRHVGEHTVLDDHARAMATALAAEVWRSSEAPTPAVLPVASSKRLRRVLETMETRLDHRLTIQNMADVGAMTPRSLSRQIMAETGLTWGDTLRRMRMIRAIEILSETDQPITEVALSVGYASLSAFNAAFKTFTGATPTAYRASAQSTR